MAAKRDGDGLLKQVPTHLAAFDGAKDVEMSTSIVVSGAP